MRGWVDWQKATPLEGISHVVNETVMEIGSIPRRSYNTMTAFKDPTDPKTGDCDPSTFTRL